MVCSFEHVLAFSILTLYSHLALCSHSASSSPIPTKLVIFTGQSPNDLVIRKLLVLGRCFVSALDTGKPSRCRPKHTTTCKRHLIRPLFVIKKRFLTIHMFFRKVTQTHINYHTIHKPTKIYVSHITSLFNQHVFTYSRTNAHTHNFSSMIASHKMSSSLFLSP